MKYLTRIYSIVKSDCVLEQMNLPFSFNAFKNPYNITEIKNLCKTHRNIRFDIFDFESKITITVTLDYIIDIIQSDNTIRGIINGKIYTFLRTIPKHLFKLLELSYEPKYSEYNGHIEEFLLKDCNDFEDIDLIECNNFDIVVCKDEKSKFGVVNYLESKIVKDDGFFYYKSSDDATLYSILDLYKFIIKSGINFSDYTRLYFNTKNRILEIGLNKEVIHYITKLITLKG